MSREVFISYRREDDAGMALALHAHLTRAISEDSIFMDVEDGIPPGHDFVQVFEDRVSECKIMLVLVGRRWLNAQAGNGARRLDNPDDFVRVEVMSAINMGKTVIPVLIDDTEMPHASDLPEAMRSFARRQAVFITSKRLRADAEGLVRILQRELRLLGKTTGPTVTAEPSQARPSLPEPTAILKPARTPQAVRKPGGGSVKRRGYIVLAVFCAIVGLSMDFAIFMDRGNGPPGGAVLPLVVATVLFGGISIAFVICAAGAREPAAPK